MDKNVGGYDRTARLLIGSILVLAGVAGYAGMVGLAVGPFPQAITAVFLVLVGAILLGTVLLQWCPINRLLGIDTCPA